MTGISSLMVGKVVPVITAAAAPSSVVWNGPDMFGFYASDTITATPTGGTGPSYLCVGAGERRLLHGLQHRSGFVRKRYRQPGGREVPVTDSLGASGYTNNVSIS